ncbi:hypothetical protein ACFYWY_34400 [Streptomyces sp. NPDC002870]|uniref:hypothetical protein n=1 Tax=Streptomyces sp. NPDC002870 TaxID=3364666 RepID=UPI0036BAFC3D
MQINYSAMMIAVVVVALAVTIFARGRWDGPVWLVILGTVLAYPFSHTLMDRVEGAPDGWLRWAFQFSSGLLVAALASPAFHWWRGRRAKAPVPTTPPVPPQAAPSAAPPAA